MSYTPQVGDRVKHPNHVSVLTVSAVGRDRFLAFEDDETVERVFLIGGAWRKVVERPTLPDMPDEWAPIGTSRDRSLYVMSAAHPSATSALNVTSGVVAAVRYTATDDVVWADEVDQ